MAEPANQQTLDPRGDGAPPEKSVSFLNDPAKRAVIFQIIILALVIAVIAFLVRNTLLNLEKQNIASGLGFMSETAGFPISESLISYDETKSYGRAFLVGLTNTLWISVWGLMFATILGFAVGVARLSPNWIVSKLALVYVETLRNIPLLLQIFFWYFAVLRPLPHPRNSVEFGQGFFLNNRGFYFPKITLEDGFGWILLVLVIAAIIASVFLSKWATKRQEQTGERFPVFWASVGMIVGIPILLFLIMGLPATVDDPALKGFNFRGGSVMTPEFIALLFALSTYTASFIAEIVRAGIMGVSHGQSEASHALGLKHGWTLRLVVIPQALRIIIPPLTSQYLNLAKNSSLAAAIAYPDLVAVFSGTTLNQTGQAVEIIGITMAVYLTISLSISMFMNWYNSKMKLVER